MVEQSLNVPAVVTVYALLLVIEAVDLLVGYLAVLDPASKNATARGTDIDRCVMPGLDATLHVLSPFEAVHLQFSLLFEPFQFQYESTSFL